MIYSMTGYGRYEVEANERKILVEVSSVNHRYLDLNIRMPRILMQYEEVIRRIVKEKLTRGKVEITISMQSVAQEDVEVVVNESLGAAYLEGLRMLGRKFDLEDDLKLSALMNINDLVSIQKKTVNNEAIEAQIESALQGALEAFIKMRQKEGEALKQDILQKCKVLSEMVIAIESRSPKVVIQYKERLKARLAQLLDGVSVDENRITTEIALFADKCAIDEEITRLKSHIKQLEEILEEGQVVGRKLDFLMQEMNREANTIGSKANDYEITKIVVALKTEIEKIREQVQNIE
ncbi:MAG: YicC family protein [Candidatus Cellulosilyticum pullistercoris]|uniref:YicC family protein n=1 Tax=Candidatus Cellulosilyticum pullistercoris TaxID=2838521 RepID=A0A9E2NM12_9FIRM|nr:YicC family protein [Candidatus Cellulosilyticum pullistercoris]